MIPKELKAVLAAAYPQCPGFCSVCSKHKIEWVPEKGKVARGYAGAAESIADIKLVLCLAEPGDPGEAEMYDNSDADRLIDDIDFRVTKAYRSVGDPFKNTKMDFHRNVRFILECCWPGESFDEQIKKTWITEGVLGSAYQTTKPVSPVVEKECSARYLSKQLALIPEA